MLPNLAWEGRNLFEYSLFRDEKIQQSLRSACQGSEIVLPPIWLDATGQVRSSREVLQHHKCVRIHLWPDATQPATQKQVFIWLEDITLYALAEKQAGEFSSLAEALPYPIFKVNAQGLVIYFNAAVRRILTQWDDDPHDLTQLLPNNLRDQVEELLLNPQEVRHYLHQVAQQTFLYTLQVSPQRDGALLFGTDITPFQQTEIELQRRIALENLITKISTQFINLPAGSVDAGINQALQQIGEFVGVDRSYVILLDPQQQVVDNTHEWCATGIDPQIHRIQRQPQNHYAWAFAQLQQQRVLYIPDVTQLPPEAASEKTEFIHQQIQSLLCVSMHAEGQPLGLIGLDSVRQLRQWTPHEVSLMQLVAQMIANALQRRRHEHELSESESRYRSLVENVPIGIYRTTPAGQILNVNQALVDMLGYSSVAELSARNVEQAGYGAGYHRHNFIEQIERHGEIKGLEVAWLRKDGSLIQVRENARAIRDARGRTLYYEGTVEDISDRRQAEQALHAAEKNYRSIFENAVEGIYQSTLDGQYLTVNPMMARILGYSSPQDLLDDRIDLNRQFYVEPGRRQQFIAVLREYGSVYGFESRVYRQDGQVIWISENARIVQNEAEELQGFEGTIIDITARKQAELSLKYRLTFEQIITTISSRFINLPPQAINHEINQALSELGSFVDVDDCFIFLYSRDRQRISLIHEHQAEGLSGLRQHFQDYPVESLSSWLELLRLGQSIHIPSVNDLPLIDTNRQLLQQAGIVSCLLVPMQVGGQLLGFLGLSTRRREERWSNDTIALVKILGEIFANTIRRQYSEQALQESENRFRQLAENIPGVVYLCQNDDRYTMQYLNDAVESLTGYAKEEFLSDRLSFAELIHPEDLPQVVELVNEGVRQQAPYHLVYRLQHLQLGWRWAEEIGVGVFEQDQLLLLEGFISDITERVEAEQRLRHTKDTLNSILQSSTEYAILATDQDYRVIHFNPMAERLFNVQESEALGRPVPELLQQRAVNLARFTRVQEILQQYEKWEEEIVIHAVDGHHRYLHLVVAPMRAEGGTRIGYVLFAQDVTERKQAYQNLRESESRYRSLFEGASDAIFLYDGDGHILDANERAVQLYGYSRAELLKLRAGGPLSADNLVSSNKTEQQLRRVRAGEALTFEWIGRRRDGSTFPEEVSLNPINISGQRYLLAIIRDVTERKLAEQMLKEQQAFLRQIIDLSPNFIFAKDREGRFTLVNQAVADAYGTTVDSLIGKGDADFNTNTDEVAHFRADDLQVMDSQQEKFIPEEKITDSRSKVRYLQTVKRPIIGGDGQAQQVLGVSTDITERKRNEAEKEQLQAQLYQAQKMESIGMLAGGIAHDFNNLLAGILGFASMATEEVGPSHPATQSLGLIVQSAEKAAKLTRELLAYARGGPRLREVFDLNQLVRDMLSLLRANIPRHVMIDQRLSQVPLVINADPAQIQQVIMNLCINAGEAIGEAAGHITITTWKTIQPPPDFEPLSSAQVEPGEYAVLEVADTGCGLPQELVQRIFEPFFSTKEFGRGMGLAAVQGIIMQHRGEIQVTSQPQQGTTFTLLLPTTDQPLPPPLTVRDPADRGSETILVADDEELVLQVAQRCLTKLGYRVITAPNGTAAINLFREQVDSIQLIILDLVMPGLNGAEVIAQLKTIAPQIRILISSGYSETMVAEQLPPGAIDGFIQKPFTAQALGQTVRQTLDLQKPPVPGS
ncbi:MAG: Sensor histidine kinase RcsC [Phycisphaerae bacterium]|nr:Sensor histidine kinase RcsC [Phycisphaerae bacterium]